MNIFHLDECPKLAAQYHCDKHVVKMIMEYCQILSTNFRHFDLATDDMLKSTHLNHPSTIWARESKQNATHLLKMLIALLNEYTLRYGKIHAYDRLVAPFKQQIKKFPLGANKLTEFVVVMHEENMLTGDVSPVDQYRHMYNVVKHHMVTYKPGRMPDWFKC